MGTPKEFSRLDVLTVMLLNIQVFWGSSTYRYTVTDVSEDPAPYVFRV